MGTLFTLTLAGLTILAGGAEAGADEDPFNLPSCRYEGAVGGTWHVDATCRACEDGLPGGGSSWGLVNCGPDRPS